MANDTADDTANNTVNMKPALGETFGDIAAFAVRIGGAGRLIGIVFGYKNEGQERLIYAYPVSRVRAELSGLAGAGK